MSGGTPFIFQFAEALSAISIPIGGGLAAYAKWRRSAERDRRAREEAARVASEKAASAARKDEASMREQLLAEKDARIDALKEYQKEDAMELRRLRQEVEELRMQVKNKTDRG